MSEKKIGHKYKNSSFYEDENMVSGKQKFIIKNFKKNENYLTKRQKFITFDRTDDNVRNDK